MSGPGSGRHARHARALAACGLALLLLAGGARRAAAHDTPYSYLDLSFAADSVHGTLMAHVFDLANAILIMPPDSLLSPTGRDAHAAALRSMLTARLHVTLDGDTLHPLFEPEIEELTERRLLRFHFTATHRVPAVVRVTGPMFPEDPAHETYVNLFQDRNPIFQGLLDVSRRSLDIYTSTRQGTWAVVRTFVAQGIHHIFIGPDHILFLIGLLLMGGGLARLLKIVTAFTIAHSITLALATLRILEPSPRLIEPLIAASIICVGIENLWSRGRRDWRAALAFTFGFVHGFGFASVLAEFGLPPKAVGWSLFAFNLGVEIGQATIVLAVAPALALLAARAPKASQRVLVGGSLVIIAAGAYWLVQRLLPVR